MRRATFFFLVLCCVSCGASESSSSPSSGGTVTPPQVDQTKPAGITALTLTNVTVNQRQSVPLSVRVFNASGSGLAGVGVSFSTSNGTLSAATVATDQNGNATVNWNPDLAPGQKLATATIPGTSFSVSFAATVAAPQVSILTSLIGGQTLTTTTNHTGTIKVKATTAGGEPAIAVSITFAAQSGTLASSSVTTDTSGVASVDWTTPSGIGKTSVTVTAPNLAAITFTFYVESGIAAKYVTSSWQSTALATNTDITPLPTVTVVDANGATVAGAPVQFSAINCTVLGGEVLTNAQGIAQPTKWTTGSLSGTQSLVATVLGLGTSTFSVTAVAGGTLVVASEPTLPIGTVLSVTLAGPTGFQTQNFTVLEPGSKNITTGSFGTGSATLPFGTYTAAWDNAYGGNPTRMFSPSPTQTTYTLSPTHPVDTVRTSWR